MKKNKLAPTTDALEIMNRMMGDDPELHRLVAQAELDFEIAQLVYDARIAAGLTQTALAKLVRTTQSAIARLEDGDYGGHSLTMLTRIAQVLDRRLEIHLVPKTKAA